MHVIKIKLGKKKIQKRQPFNKGKNNKLKNKFFILLKKIFVFENDDLKVSKKLNINRFKTSAKSKTKKYLLSKKIEYKSKENINCFFKFNFSVNLMSSENNNK